MKKIENIAWTYYIEDDVKLDPEKVGKWMYFFSKDDDLESVDKLCSKAVELGVVKESKHTKFDFIGRNPLVKDEDRGVCCFYLHCDDMEGHRKIIQYFLDNNMIQKTKNGRYYNISFKLDKQTLNMEYGNKFQGILKLEQFIDLFTGEWIGGKNQ